MIILTSSGKPLLINGGAVRTPDAGGGAVTPADPVTPGADMPTSSMTGWWDISSRAVGSSYSIGGRSPTTKAATLSLAGGTPKVAPRNAGLLPGFYEEGPASNFALRQPVILDYAINATAMPVGTNQDIAVYLVWSRPNLRQVGAVLNTSPVTLLRMGTTDVLQMAANGTGSDQLTLFPSTGGPSAGSMPLRHTRGVLVQFVAGTVSAWLDDGTALFSNVANPSTLGSTVDIAFLRNAQLIFHEGAVWNKALSSTERAAVFSNATRWPMGLRRAANTMMIGQSNAGAFTGAYSLVPRLNTSIAYMTGQLASNSLWVPGNLTVGSTFNAGQGLYDAGSDRFLNSTVGGDPSTWPLGTNGNAYMTAIDALTADDRANVFAVWWFWSETMSQYLTYARKAECIAAHIRAFGLIRARLGRTAATLPIMVIDALPYITPEGCQTHREVMQALVDTAGLNVRYMLTQAGDATGQADGWDPTTGQETGPGDGGHRDVNGMLEYQRRMAAPMARAILAAQVAAGTPDVLTAIDASIPVAGGPKIAAAQYEGGTSVLVTLQHDGGNDLIVPLKAVQGVGWALMDGVSDTVAGTPGAPGVLITATACARVSATQVRITLASAPAHAAKAKLYYPYGQSYDPATSYATIGRGNAVTDNFSAVTLPAGWKIGADRGAAEQPNYPVQASAYGVALT